MSCANLQHLTTGCCPVWTPLTPGGLEDWPPRFGGWELRKSRSHVGRPDAVSADGGLGNGSPVCIGSHAGWGYPPQMRCRRWIQSHECSPASSSDTPAKTPGRQRKGPLNPWSDCVTGTLTLMLGRWQSHMMMSRSHAPHQRPLTWKQHLQPQTAHFHHHGNHSMNRRSVCDFRSTCVCKHVSDRAGWFNRHTAALLTMMMRLLPRECHHDFLGGFCWRGYHLQYTQSWIY